MGRKRTRFKGLPIKVTWKNGAHYYTPRIEGKLKYIWLGRSPNPNLMSAESALAWRSLSMGACDTSNSMGEVFDHYERVDLPKLGKKTQKDYRLALKNLRAVFSHMRADAIKPSHIYKYQEMRSQGADVAPNREVSVLSGCFVRAIRKGWVDNNPCKLVKRLSEKPRDRYIEDWEFRAVYSIANITVKCAMMIAYQSTQRRGDILKIKKKTDLTPEGIYVKQGKRGKKILIKWNAALRKAVDDLINFRSHLNSEYLFVSRSGEKMTEDGFSTLWQKTINKALKLKLIEERFTFHDFKAKSVSDDKGKHKSKRSGHTSEAFTDRTYDRGHHVVDSLIRETDILIEEAA